MKGISLIVETLAQQAEVEVLWLYGSRANDNHHQNSDYDLAVAFNSLTSNRFQSIDDLHYALNKIDDIKESISIVDINQVPTPLAISIIDEGRVLHCQSDLRLRQEQQRVWSLWEEYKYQHASNRKEL